MPLVKQTVTPDRLAANRRAARKSTGPRTAAGKSRSSLNALRGGCRSKTIELLLEVISEAPQGGVLRMARQKMTPAQLSLPTVADTLNLFEPSGTFPSSPTHAVIPLDNHPDVPLTERGKYNFLRHKR